MRRLSDYKHVLWDWNGTLLDDVWLAVQVMNGVLARRSLPLLNRERYRELFDFPVSVYYARLGFDWSKESFESITQEFIAEYYRRCGECELQDGAVRVLQSIQAAEIPQSILSAAQEASLWNSIGKYGIEKFFERIVGLSNHHANSKLEIGKKLVAKLGVNPKDLLLIGDTAHDYQVANDLGMDCLLVANGHHAKDRLSKLTGNVVESIGELSENIRRGR